MQSLDIALKGIKAVFIYNMLREGVPKVNGTWEKRIQVVITYGVRDMVRQGMLLFSNCVYRNEILQISGSINFFDFDNLLMFIVFGSFDDFNNKNISVVI